jgi:dTDP-4-amino-4,6-dideoxy-D-galactose acyltransferase
MQQLEGWCYKHAIDCVYLLADSDHVPTSHLAETHGFRRTDTRLTLARSLNAPTEIQAGNRLVRLWHTSDIPALRRLASHSHRDSRFYQDGCFAHARCDELYATWIERSCAGYADLVLVAEVAGQVGGYITGHLRESGEGQIGLLAVDAACQKQGVGQQLVAAALDWFATQQIQHVSVVTQERNQRAQRFYERCGFAMQSMQFWYHRWFTSAINKAVKER